MAETKNTGLGLQQTKGSFQLRGVVTGTDKDNFYKEITTKSNKPMRITSFGVNIDKGKAVYVRLQGMTRDNVYFSKTEGEGKTRKTVTEKVAWKDRYSFNKEGFKLIGIRMGLEKVTDKTGNQVNKQVIYSEYDACKYIADKLVDESSVFIRGDLEYSTYNDKHYTQCVPKQISLCKPIDFDAEDYTVVGNFEQVIVFMGIKKNSDGTFTVESKIVTYNTIEDFEFVVKNEKLAKNFKTLKPYTAIKVYGNITVEHDTEEIIEADDGWGETNPMERINNPTIRQFVIIGADKTSIDTDTYSEELIEEAIAKVTSNKQADKDYGDSDDWSKDFVSIGIDDDDEW